MTITVDDAGSGDLLWGVVIGAYKEEDEHFLYDLIPVGFFQDPSYGEGKHKGEAAGIAVSLVERLQPAAAEKIRVCQGDILNEAAAALKERYGEDRVERVRVEGETQRLVELAYTDELRNLGYEPLPERTERWGRSFRDMYSWIKESPSTRVKLAKSGFPNVKKYPLFGEKSKPRRGQRPRTGGR